MQTDEEVGKIAAAVPVVICIQTLWDPITILYAQLVAFDSQLTHPDRFFRIALVVDDCSLICYQLEPWSSF